MTQRFKYRVDLFSSTVFISLVFPRSPYFIVGSAACAFSSFKSTQYARDWYFRFERNDDDVEEKKIIQLARLSVLQISTGFRVTLRTFFPLLVGCCRVSCDRQSKPSLSQFNERFTCKPSSVRRFFMLLWGFSGLSATIHLFAPKQPIVAACKSAWKNRKKLNSENSLPISIRRRANEIIIWWAECTLETLFSSGVCNFPATWSSRYNP